MHFGRVKKGLGVRSRACKHRWTELTGACREVDGSEATAADPSARGWAALHRSRREYWPRKWSQRAVEQSQRTH